MSDFQDWLSSGTIKRRTVNLYADAAIMDEMDALDARIAQVEAEEAQDTENGDRPMSAASAIPALVAQAEELWARYEASKSIFHVTANSDAEKDDADDAFPAPAPPVRLGPDATEAEKADWDKRLLVWKRQHTEAERRRKCLLISQAIKSVEHGDGSPIEPPSADDLHAMARRPYGSERIKMLWDAVTEAGKQGEAPAPFLRKGSDKTPD